MRKLLLLLDHHRSRGHGAVGSWRRESAARSVHCSLHEWGASGRRRGDAASSNAREARPLGLNVISFSAQLREPCGD